MTAMVRLATVRSRSTHRRVIPLVLALLAGSLAWPALAQRGGSHGGGHAGFAGHSAPAVHSGGGISSFRGSAPVRMGAGRPFAAGRGFPAARGIPASRGLATSRMSYGARAPYYGSRGYGGGRGYRPDRYRPVYRGAFVYGAPLWPGWDPYYLGYPDDYGYDDSGAPDAQAYAGPEYPQYPEDPQEPTYPQYQPYPAPQAPASGPGSTPASAGMSQEAVTLVFRDGRPSEQVHNYMLTSGTLYVLDGRRREIPIEQLDVAATEKANRDAGVDFRIPGAVN